jgi:hypothetical protein
MSYDDANALDVKSLMTPNPSTRKKWLGSAGKKDKPEKDVRKFTDALEKNSHNGAFIGMKGDFSNMAKVS